MWPVSEWESELQWFRDVPFLAEEIRPGWYIFDCYNHGPFKPDAENVFRDAFNKRGSAFLTLS